ncbi:MAG: acyl CoA:acetate/3-ketoacid CoA transferase [Dehalococcoidia bacterium]|nr:MAG: acyl CoA:acetate/3-ketoacid CoA transferase [Dehalococcoidia bacterium]
MSKIMSAEDAIKLVEDGYTITGTGFSFIAPEELFIALENSFLNTRHPRDLTLLIPGGAGDLRGAGFDHFAHEGFIRKVIAPYFNLTPALGRMVLEEKVECYMLPSGVICQLLRDIGAKRPGLITHVGLKTFVDPRLEGGKLNSISKEDYIELIEIDGKEWLRYKPIHIDVAILKVTTADEFGNATMEKEAGFLVTLPMAIATHNCGGKVIEQVERVTVTGTLNPQHVQVPGSLVDAIVIARPEHHWMTWREQYNPARSGEVRVADIGLPVVPMRLEKVVARRVLYELEAGKVVNLGAGMSEFISSLAWEEKIFDKMILTVEAGMIGGVPGYGLQFNTASNPYAIIDQSFQMDLYDGGGNDISCVGFAQIDKKGNVNVSKLEGRILGVGGFLNVCPKAKKRVHCGAFTAGKSEIKVKDGKLEIIKDGNITKFVDKVEQITLSGECALEEGQPTIIITERCVFDFTKDGFILKEIAPGVDIKEHILEKMEFKPIISDDLKYMSEELFKDALLNLRDREPWKGYSLY